MKFKDSENWGKDGKFYGQAAIDLISTLLVFKAEDFDRAYIYYRCPRDTYEEIEYYKDALDFLEDKTLEQIKNITIYYTDKTVVNIYIRQSDFNAFTYYAEIDMGRYWHTYEEIKY